MGLPTNELCEHQRARAAAVALARSALGAPEVDDLIKLAEYIVHGAGVWEQLGATEQEWDFERDEKLADKTTAAAFAEYEKLFGKDPEHQYATSTDDGRPDEQIAEGGLSWDYDNEPDVSVAPPEVIRGMGLTFHEAPPDPFEKAVNAVREAVVYELQRSREPSDPRPYTGPVPKVNAPVFEHRVDRGE